MSTEPHIIPVGGELPPLLTPAERDAQRAAPTSGKPAGKSKGLPEHRRAAVRRRFGLLNAVIDRALPHLGCNDFKAWILLYRHAGPDGTVRASVADLARRAGCCEAAMRRALKRLQSDGLVIRLKRGTLAGGPSVWRLLLPEGDGP